MWWFFWKLPRIPFTMLLAWDFFFNTKMVKFCHHKNHCFSTVFLFFAIWSKGNTLFWNGSILWEISMFKRKFPQIAPFDKKNHCFWGNFLGLLWHVSLKFSCWKPEQEGCRVSFKEFFCLIYKFFWAHNSRPYWQAVDEDPKSSRRPQVQ